METIKVKIRTNVERDIEFSLPAFRKYGGSYFKVIAEGDAIKVDTYYGGFGIERGAHLLGSAYMEGSEYSTEQEFNEAYNSILEKIKQWNTPT